MINIGLCVLLVVFACVIFVQHRRLKLNNTSDQISLECVRKSCRSMINAENTANPLLALIDSYRGLIMLEVAIELSAFPQSLKAAHQQFEKFTSEVRDDLSRHLPVDCKIVENQCVLESDWS